MSREDTLYSYLLENSILSDKEIDMLRSCSNEIQSIAPSDMPLLFKKENTLIDCSHKLSWCIYSVNRRLNKERTEYRKIKDPEYVMLVRQGRPSSAAIDAEIRFKHNDFYDREEKIKTLENILDYFNNIQSSIDRYIFMLRDKAKFGA